MTRSRKRSEGEPMPLVGRVWNLLRGLAARWVGRREQRHPDAVYVAAIGERVTQYAKLREAAAGIIYLRSKLAKELERESAELGRVGRQLEIAVERDDDAVALHLIGRRDGLGAEVTRLTAELTELTKEAEGAKQNLVTFQREIARLREERVRMLARLASAKARLRFQATLNGLSPDADIRALEEVRDHVNRLVAETQVARDLGDSELEKRLGRIREAEAESAARAQLDELKRARRGRLLPMVLPEAVPVRCRKHRARHGARARTPAGAIKPGERRVSHDASSRNLLDGLRPPRARRMGGGGALGRGRVGPLLRRRHLRRTEAAALPRLPARARRDADARGGAHPGRAEDRARPGVGRPPAHVGGARRRVRRGQLRRHPGDRGGTGAGRERGAHAPGDGARARPAAPGAPPGAAREARAPHPDRRGGTLSGWASGSPGSPSASTSSWRSTT